MSIGITVPLPAYNVDVALIAKKAEELGFESIWCAEHPIIPVHSDSPFPGSSDGVIPESYSHFVDPFVALAEPQASPRILSWVRVLPWCRSATPFSWPRRSQHWTTLVGDGSSLESAPAGFERKRRLWVATLTTVGRRLARLYR